MSAKSSAIRWLEGLDRSEDVRARLRIQGIRDAHLAGATQVEIAAALGVKSRGVIVAAIKSMPPTPEEGMDPGDKVAAAPAVLVRGKGVDKQVWRQVEAAINLRGWWMIRDVTQAWHLSRGRLPVVQVELAADPVQVGLVRATGGGDTPRVLQWAREPLTAAVGDPDAVALTIIQALSQSDAVPLPLREGQER